MWQCGMRSGSMAEEPTLSLNPSRRDAPRWRSLQRAAYRFWTGAISLKAGLRSSDARGRRALARGFAQRGQLAGLLPLRGGPLGRLLPDVGKLQARLVDRQL